MPFGVHLLKVILPTRCIDALFWVRIPFGTIDQSPEANPDSSPPVQSSYLCLWEIDTRDLPIFILWLQSLKTLETPGLSITFGTFSATVFRNQRLLNLLSLLLQHFHLLSCLHARSRNAFNCHGKSKSLTAKTNSLTAKANQLRMRYFYSGDQSVLEVLPLLTVGHRYHSPCFTLTLSSRVAANIVNVKANMHTSSGWLHFHG